jgi:hypothetical protein
MEARTDGQRMPDLAALGPRMRAIQTAARALRARNLDPLPSWLRESQAMSTFGLTGEAIWRRTLDGFEGVGDRIAASIDRIHALVEGAPDDVQPVVVDLHRALHYAAPEAWEQDFGYQGVLKTLDTAHELLRQAQASFGIDLPESQDPYEHDDLSPYHLVAACYYSGLGIYLNAWYLLRVYESRLEDLTLLREIRSQRAAPRRTGSDEALRSP